jgi:hypothetical protein
MRMLATIMSLASALTLAALVTFCPSWALAADSVNKTAAPVAVVQPVWPSLLDPGHLDPVYSQLPFNTPDQDFMAALRDRFVQRLRPRLEASPDPNNRDKLKMEMERSLTKIAGSWTEFKGQDSGYGVSVIANEYAESAKESVYQYLYGANSAYFLLSDGQLWKLVLCLQWEGGFPVLLKKLSELYGEPSAMDEVERKGEKQIKQVSWVDSSFELTAIPADGILVCNRLRWVYKPALELVTARRIAGQSAEGGKDEAKSLIDRISEEKQGQENVDDIYDQILNKK